MNPLKGFITVVVWTIALCCTTIRAMAESPQSVGLVLSGGGAKGIAHIGVIKALEENNIPIDYIAGTSMGAIVGGLYAAGYTTDEMMELINSQEFVDASSGHIDRRYSYYFLHETNEPKLFSLNLGEKSGAMSLLPTSVINPIPMNFEFMALFSPFTAQCGGDFNNLFVPFRAVASDVTHKRKVVWRNGSLGEAIRSSMSFPLVFYPVEKDGALLYDGGIYDNFPVQVMTNEFAPSVIIGVDVSTPDSVTANPDMVTQLSEMIIQPGRGQLTSDQGVYMHINLTQFGLMDFAKADKISDIGYNRAIEVMDTIKAKITARMPREARELQRRIFKSRTPYLRFDSVSVSGATERQNNYIRSYFTNFRTDTFGLASAASSYYRLAAPGKFRNLDPTAVYNDTTSMFRLDLKASVKDKYTVGFGGYVSTTTSSMLYFSGAYKTLSYNSLSLGLSVWAGQSYLAGMLKSQISFATSVPSALMLEIVGSRHKYYDSEKLFFEESQPSYVTSNEAFARIQYGFAPNRIGRVDVGLGVGYLGDKYYQTLSEDWPHIHRDKVRQLLGQAKVGYRSSTLNNYTYPTRGAEYSAVLMGVAGTHNVNGDNRGSKHRRWAQ
nr:patatin-like phospholipase family protein [Paramuribaculum sp.]